MNRKDVDVMWQVALVDAIRESENFTRYHFARLIAERYALQVERMGMEGYGTLAIAAAIRNDAKATMEKPNE